MFGRRARIGVLVPPGNPTVEPELYRMAPDGVSVHFARLQAPPAEGPRAARAAWRSAPAPTARASTAGGGARQVHPAVIVLAHTASSYALGVGRSSRWSTACASLCRAPALLAAHAVRVALHHLGVTRLALGTPYPESISRQGRAYWEAAGFEIVGYHRLAGVTRHLLGERGARGRARAPGRHARGAGGADQRDRAADRGGARAPRA